MSKEEQFPDIVKEIEAITTLEALQRTIQDLQESISKSSPVGFALVVSYAEEENSVGVYVFPDKINGDVKESGEMLALRLFQAGVVRVVEDLHAFGPKQTSDFLDPTLTVEELISKVDSDGKNKKPH